MNKQEAIEKIEKEKSDLNAWEDLTRNRALDDALAIVRKLDEPEKPVVPKYVADYIASEQHSCSTFSEAIDNMDDEKEVLCWFYDNSETFAKAWIYGYEVEKEKLYTVELPNPNKTDVSIVLGLYNNDRVAIFSFFKNFWKYEKHEKQYKLTEAEIKEDFEWAWQFAKEVEE